MKKLVLFLLLCIPLMVQTTFAQMEVVGSNEYGRIFDINFDPNVENKLYAVTLGNHIVESNDKGITWDILYSYPETNASIKSLRILPDNRVSFFITYGVTDKIIILNLKSLQIEREYTLPIPENSEKEWISAYSLWQSNPDTAIVLQGFKIGLANFAKVYYTTNGGTDWDEIYYNVDFDEVFPWNVAISPANSQKLFIMRGNGPTDIDGGLFVSENAGESWNELFAGTTFNAISFNPSNPNDVLLGTFITGPEETENLLRSSDGGNTWDTIPISWTPQIQDNINDIIFNPTDVNNIIVLEENEVVITHDNFATHEIYVYPDYDTFKYYYGLTASFNPFKGNEVIISCNYYPFFSEDSGATMSRILSPYFVSTGNVSINEVDVTYLYYGVQFGYVRRDLSTGVETPFDIKPLDYMATSYPAFFTDPLIAGRIYTYQSSFMGKELLVSNDHGSTSFPVYSGFTPTFHTVVSDPSNPSIIWASFSSWGESPEVYKIDFTDQSNVQSEMITLPFQDIVTGIYIDPASSLNIILAIGTKVFLTTDGGATWTESTGLSELIEYNDLILKFANNPLDNQQFSIATNVGIFTSTDGGLSWVKIHDGLFHDVIHSKDVNGDIVGITNVSMISESSISFSNDNGETWGQISNSDLQFIQAVSSAVSFDDNIAEVYLGTDDIGVVKVTLDMNTVGTSNKPVNSVTIYPNPVTENLTISGLQVGAPVEIYDLSGRMVMNTTNSTSLNLTDLESGAYLLKTISKSGERVFSKFIKK